MEQGDMKTLKVSEESFLPSINLFLFSSHVSTCPNEGKSLGSVCFLLDSALKANVCGLIKA